MHVPIRRPPHASNTSFPMFSGRKQVNAGQHRCGICPSSPDVVTLARAIVELPSLHFNGLHVYNGSIQHVRSSADREIAVETGPAHAARLACEQLARKGIDVRVVTGVGTGTLRWAKAVFWATFGLGVAVAK